MNDENNPRISSNLLFVSLLLILTFLKKDFSDGTVTVSKRSDRKSVHLKKALFIFHEELTGLHRDSIFVLEGLINQSVCINVICNAPILSTISDQGRKEIRALLKTPAWEATIVLARCVFCRRHIGKREDPGREVGEQEQTRTLYVGLTWSSHL